MSKQEDDFQCSECTLRRDFPTPEELESGKCEFCLVTPFEERDIKPYFPNKDKEASDD